MSRVLARGACPGLSAPMETGDGLLARLLPNGPMPLDAFIGLCEAAGVHGNGIIEVSARGSLQIRGLTPLSAPRFADAVAALAIDIGESVPVIADPLPDDPAALIDANGLAAQLRQAIAEAGLTLAPKVSVVVDGGGRLDLDALTADIRLRAVPTREGPRFQLGLAGDAASAVPVATISPGEAVAEVLALLKLIAARGPEARARDVLPDTRRAAISAGHVPAIIALGSGGPSSPQRRRRRAWARPCFRPCRGRRSACACPDRDGQRRRLGAACARPCAPVWTAQPGPCRGHKGRRQSASASWRRPPIHAAASPPVPAPRLARKV